MLLCLIRPWKFEHIAIGFLSLLLRDDHPLPAPAVRFLVQSLNHDALVVRKVHDHILVHTSGLLMIFDAYLSAFQSVFILTMLCSLINKI